MKCLLKILNFFFKLMSLPGGKKFFEKVFLISMESTFKISKREEHAGRTLGSFKEGLGVSLEIAKYAVMPGALTLLSQQGGPEILIGGGMFLTGMASIGTLLYDVSRKPGQSTIKSLKSGANFLLEKAFAIPAKTIDFNFFSKTKVARKLKAESGESTISEAAEVIKSSASISDKLDFDFGGIKQELARGIQRDIHIPNWGKEFSIGVSNLMTRLSLIREELVQINEKVDPIFNEIQQAKINKTTYQREATETLNELYGDKLFALLIDHQAIELDLITLSHALDQYIIGLDKYAKSAEHTPAEQYFINSKSELLRSQLLTLTMFVKPLTDYKQNIITILDTLNMTTASAQMNDMQNLNSKPLRENNKEKKPKEPYEIMRGFHI
ncbi:MAG: hypothetical protein L6Q37_06350 [Bdellovibrionaceae bacterium]|nr:hypothetical protein [Pseudobdellovibrionaceae bacterium]